MILNIPRIGEGEEYPLGMSYKIFGSQDYQIFDLVFRGKGEIAKIRFERAPDGSAVSVQAINPDAHAEIKITQSDFLQDMITLFRRYGMRC